MNTIVISVLAFVVLLLLPILFSMFFLRKGKGDVLDIEQSKLKDPRYFVKSFTRLFDQKWVNYDGSRRLFLSREEKILEADTTEKYPVVCHSIVYAEKHEFRPPKGIRFKKEVYSCQNAYLSGIEIVRAVCSKKDLVLGDNTKVLRWADAEGVLTVLDGCDLGVSASSNTRLIIGHNCRFRRLYAPAIILGQAAEQEPLLSDSAENFDFKVSTSENYIDVEYVNDDLAGENGLLNGSIRTKHDITILNRLTVGGHIRSHKSIRLCDDAVVYGNIFAEGDIHLGQNSRVYGSVFTQGNLHAENGVFIGQSGKTKSVIARGEITFGKNCRVYGYVSSEAGGKCCPDDSRDRTALFMLPASLYQRLYEGLLSSRLFPVLLSAFLILAIIFSSISATAILKNIQAGERLSKEKRAAADEPVYGIDGKPGGGQLDAEPILATKDHIYYRDRVLERFHYDAKSINNSTEALSVLMRSIPKNINKHIMIAPLRISLENSSSQYSDNTVGVISQLYANMPSDVQTIDAAGALLKHKDEYLFFRTDNVWTALGAYYAAEEFCKRTGIAIKGISEYSENRFKNYVGPMHYLPGTKDLKKYPDYISYYTLQGASNEQIITSYRGDGDYLTYRTPTIAVSRLGYNIFVGSNFSHSFIKGDAKNEKSLMVMGDAYSNALVPWLTPYYEYIFLVNPKLFYGGSDEFRQLLSDYQITDFLFMENIQSIGNSKINDKINELCKKP